MIKSYFCLSPNNILKYVWQINSILNFNGKNMSHEIDLKLEVNTK
ncbi:hypothetical protein yrohd0001_34530 [Yersinia rohdei ATCC 43380]|nr:hypothetical protein yrohd0001_34530 [Yersinia rohdei ATCC 43380]